MKNSTISWSQVKIKDILTYVGELTEIDDIEEYTTITVKRYHGGLVEREKLLGSQIKTKKQYSLIPGAFIISRVQCWHEAYAIVPDEIEPNMIASTNYDQFKISPDVDKRFFWWLSFSPSFTHAVRDCAFGVVIEKMVFNRDIWLNKSIFLPPLEEQRRIVAHIEEFAAKIEEARGLQNQVQDDLYVLCQSIFFDSTKKKPIPTPMNNLVSLRETDVFVDPEETYHFAGIYSFGRGMFKGQNRPGTDFSYTKLTSLKTNNFVYPKLMAWEGALAVVPPDCENLVVSPEFPVFEVNQDKVLPETLEIYFQSPYVWPLLSGVSTGTNVRRRRLNPSDFLAFEMPLPSMETQILLREVSMRAKMTKRYHVENSAELNALLPSILDKAFKGEL